MCVCICSTRQRSAQTKISRLQKKPRPTKAARAATIAPVPNVGCDASLPICCAGEVVEELAPDTPAPKLLSVGVAKLSLRVGVAAMDANGSGVGVVAPATSAAGVDGRTTSVPVYAGVWNWSGRLGEATTGRPVVGSCAAPWTAVLAFVRRETEVDVCIIVNSCDATIWLVTLYCAVYGTTVCTVL